MKFIPFRPRGLNITSNEHWNIGCRNVEYVNIKTIGHRKCKMFARILIIGNKKMQDEAKCVQDLTRRGPEARRITNEKATSNQN